MKADRARRWLEENLQRVMAHHEVPGVSVAVLVDGQVIEDVAGVVNRRTGVQVTPDTLFMIQSVTKVWTATLVLQLVDEGLVELDLPVRQYLPGFRTADAETSQRITVRHLLSHTGGFEGDLWADTTRGADALQRFVEDLVSTAAQHREPGSRYSYCNAGFGVLGRLVEVKRNLPYEQAFRRFLAEPLGIAELAFDADQALAFRTAIGHVRATPDAPPRPTPHWAVMPPSNPAAGNQLAMSARSLIAFATMHLGDGRTAHGTRVLSAGSATAMRTRQIDRPAALGPAAGCGLGWQLGDRPGVVEHGGSMTGVCSLLRTVPADGVAVVVLTNSDSGADLADEIAEALLAELTSVAPATPLPTVGAGVRAREPRRFVGSYPTRVAGQDVSLDDDGRLWLVTQSQHEALEIAARAGVPSPGQRFELRPVEGGIFVMTVDGHPLRVVEFLGPDADCLYSGGRISLRA